MSRAATSRLKVNPPLGMRPSLEFRRPADLNIDPSYQRSIEAAASQTLIRRIAQFWDWSLCQPLTVARRADGTLMVVDGQHRLEAARLRRDIEDLPCVVTSYSSAGDEAAAFVALNQQRRPLGAIDLFKAALAAEDDDARKIARLLTEAGLRLAPHTNFTAWKPGMVSNISGIQTCLRVHGERVTALSLTALAKAFAGQVLRYAGSIFPGICSCVAQELRIEGKFDVERLTAALAHRSQEQWRQEIVLEQAAAGVDRRLAAKTVVTKAYREPAAVASPTQAPGVPAPCDAEPGEFRWCSQCDRRVSGAVAGACTSPFCKAKARAA
jgi:hypothetical protein